MPVPLRMRRRQLLCRAGWTLCLTLFVIWLLGTCVHYVYMRNNWGVGCIGSNLVIARLPWPMPPVAAQFGIGQGWEVDVCSWDHLFWRPYTWFYDRKDGYFVSVLPLWLAVLLLTTVMAWLDRNRHSAVAEGRCKYCLSDTVPVNRGACGRCTRHLIWARLAVLLLAIRVASDVNFEFDAAGAVALPWACLVTCWSVVPLLLRLRYRRRLDRILLGYCACCGYNLTGNVSGICPECGTHCHSRVLA
jgi:hypothetical protein